MPRPGATADRDAAGAAQASCSSYADEAAAGYSVREEMIAESKDSATMIEGYGRQRVTIVLGVLDITQRYPH